MTDHLTTDKTDTTETQREYDVEIRAVYREVYVVLASSPEEAAANWVEGDLAISECMYTDGVTEVRESEDD